MYPQSRVAEQAKITEEQKIERFYRTETSVLPEQYTYAPSTTTITSTSTSTAILPYATISSSTKSSSDQPHQLVVMDPDRSLPRYRHIRL